MKFLIDECLSPELAKIARDQDYPETTHIQWLGLSGAKDHSVTRKAVDDGYILVTHNTVDFLPLYDQEEVHVGLICINVAPGLMSLELQKRLFLLVLQQLAGEEAWNEVLEISIAANRTVSMNRYDLPH